MSSYLDQTGLTTLWSNIKSSFVAQEDGMSLSSNDYTDEDKEKVANSLSTTDLSGGTTDYGTISISDNTITLTDAVGIKGTGTGAEIFNGYTNNEASGNYSISTGYGTIASGQNSVAMGKYNVEDTNDTYALIIGNGTSESYRSDALKVDWDGNATIIGDLIYNGEVSLTDSLQDITTTITEMQTTDAELRVKIGSDYSTLYSLIEELQSADETLSGTITSNYNELSESISTIDTLSSTLDSHISDTDVHLTTDERTLWNSGISYSLPSTTIPDESDADDYTTDGQYVATSPSTLTNFAQSTYGFELIVMHTVSSNRGMQIMLCSNGDIYVRAFNSANSNGAFYGMSWKQLTSTSE